MRTGRHAWGFSDIAEAIAVTTSLKGGKTAAGGEVIR